MRSSPSHSQAKAAKPTPKRGGRRSDHRAELERLRVLYKISNILMTAPRSDTMLRLILKEAVKVTHATSGSLILIDREAGVLNIEIAYNIDAKRAMGMKLRIGEGVTGWVAKTGKPLLVGDVKRSPHYVRIKTDVKSELAVPLIIGKDVVGVINVDSDRPNAFTTDDRDLLMAVAAQSSKVMQAGWLYQENRHKAERLETLFNVARAVVSEPLLEDALRRIADEVRELMDVRVCSIILLDDRAEKLEIKAVSGEVSPEYINRRSIDVADNVIGRAIRNAQPLYVADVRKEKEYRLRRVARESGLCSLLCVPMIFLNRPIGVLNIYSGEPRYFPEEDVTLLRTFAGHAAVAIVNAQRFHRIMHSEELLRQSEKFQMLGTLAAEIAHEVRNPLTIMGMLVHTVREDEGLSTDSRRDLEVIAGKIGHINRIVDQVLDFSRSNRSEPVRVNVADVIEDLQLLLGPKAATMGMRVRTQIEENLPPVLGYPGQLEQAILNLALNGMEAMKPKGGELTLSAGVQATGDVKRVRIGVKDEGCGIPPEKIEEIFLPFFSMSDQGTGLGLFITGRIVKEHGGELKVKSKAGKGSTFEILLPASTVEAEPIAAFEATRTPGQDH